MKSIVMLLAFGSICNSINAQDDTTNEKTIDEIIVYSNKFAERKKNIAQKIDVITAKSIAQINSQNTGDLLMNTGSIFIQKSQQGGSSPVLRGFEASRVLIIVDGVRLNNAIFRSGHLQNVITIDQNMLERVEVMQGPASTLYGSDALGGVVHLRSKSPTFSVSTKLLIKGSVFSRYSTANNEKTIHADVSIGGKKLAWMQSYTFSDFGDMKMGKNYRPNYPNFGRRDSLIAFFGGIDSVIANNNPNKQIYSGYKQCDILQKLVYHTAKNINQQLYIQISNTTDVPRYDRQQDKKDFGGTIGNTLRFAKWYYGPQKRLLTSYELTILPSKIFNEIKANINYQYVEESRNQREYRRYDRLDARIEKVNVLGFVVDARKLIGNNELTMGIDGQLNDVKSTANRTNIITGANSRLDTRYPDGKNKMNYFGAYAQHLLKIKKGKWVLNDGLRLQLVSLRSNVIDNSFFNLPETNFKQMNVAVTGNLGLIYIPSQSTRASLSISSGFRTPNLDDLVKIFDFSIAKRVYVPNANIKPEYTYNFEWSLFKKISKSLQFEATLFNTLFRNAIVSTPFQLNGKDSIIYNGVNSAVYANQNLNKARLAGFSTNVKLNINKNFSVSTSGSYTYGRVKKFNGLEVPLDHIPPFFGKTLIKYQQAKIEMELYSMYNGWKRIKNYNPDGEDNQQYATVDGMPSWFTFNLKSSFSFSKKIQLQLGVENIFDRNYRYFASGFSAAGRNFIIAVRGNL